MAAKRGPTSDLNHNNWDHEEEPEEAGHFKEANESELKNRVIKKARRRITDSTNADESAPKNIFGGFSGFGKAAETSATDGGNKSSLFSFLSKIPAAAPAANANKTVASSTQSFSFVTTTTTSAVVPKKADTANFTFGKTEPSKDEAYYAKVIKLNQSFCDWIKKHVDEQPLCNLMSTFKDYETYWEQLKKEKDTKTTAATTPPAASTSSVFSNIKFNTTSPTQVFGFGSATATESKLEKNNGLSFASSAKPNGNATTTTTSPIKPASNGSGSQSVGISNLMSAPKADAPKPFSFGIKPDDKSATSLTTSNTPASTGFSFGMNKDASVPAPAAAPAFSFGLKTNEKPAATGFSFTPGSTPFSFGNIKPPAAVTSTNNQEGEENDDDEDEPPKVEIKEIVEEDAFYTKKCKVFLKKDNAYKDFGIAMLYLKPIEGSSKTQLLVRASALGKILINTILAEATPVQRVGKNNVMIIYPNADGETQTNLIRVKDANEADDLLATLNKHKK